MSEWDMAYQLNAQVLDEYGDKNGTKMIALLAGYKDVPPDIDTFIDDKHFMGTMLGENLYPEWRQQLRAIYPNPFRSPFYQVIAAGAVGVGKTSLTLGIQAYDLCKLTYVKDPQLTYQLLPSQEITVAFFNANKVLAQRVLMSPFLDWLLSSPYFRGEMAKLRDRHRADHIRTKSTQLFMNNIGVVPASRSGDILGMACIGAGISEIEFMDKVKSQAPEAYRQVQRRMSSRFERGEGYLEPGHLVVDSSARYAEGFQAKLMNEARRDPEQKTLIIEKAIWEVLEPAGKIKLSGKRFKLFVGDAGGREPIILDPRQSYTLPEALCIDVPEEYRKYFVNDIYGAIRDFAGKSTVNIHKFFTNINLLKECMPETDVNPCRSTVVELDFYDETDRLINHIDMDKLVKGIPYYIHIDIGVVGCKTGIALTRPSETKLINRIGRYLEDNYVQDVVFRTDLLLAIAAKPGQEVPIAKLRNFIIDLRHHGFRIEWVSYDQFQSRQLHQELDTYGINNELVSVDRTRDPYDSFKNIVAERRWSGPYHPILEHELINLVDTGMKIVKPDDVDATFGTEPTTKAPGSISKDEEKKKTPSKDVADALVGSVFLAKDKCGTHASGAALDAYVKHMEATERKLQLQDHIFELAKQNKTRFFR